MSLRSESDHKPDGDAVRTFICIEIPESIRERIEDLQRALKPAGAQASWVKPGNIHLTLKFLGDVNQARLDSIRDATSRALQHTGPFEIEVGGTGCFPSPKNPRVLWVGLAKIPDALRQAQAAIEDELAREGFPREPKRFSPHLTIARLRSQHNARQLAENLIAKGFENQSFQAAEIIIMRSQLNPSGSVYTPLAIIPLSP